MTEYPPRKDVETTKRTLLNFHDRLDKEGTLLAATAAGTLWHAVLILDTLDDAPSPAPAPAPAPEITAAEVLREAWLRAYSGSAEESILWAAYTYAEDHPEWFCEWNTYTLPSSALVRAGTQAAWASDSTAYFTLNAASNLATERPALFGDPA